MSLGELLAGIILLNSNLPSGTSMVESENYHFQFICLALCFFFVGRTDEAERSWRECRRWISNWKNLSFNFKQQRIVDEINNPQGRSKKLIKSIQSYIFCLPLRVFLLISVELATKSFDK